MNCSGDFHNPVHLVAALFDDFITRLEHESQVIKCDILTLGALNPGYRLPQFIHNFHGTLHFHIVVLIAATE